MLTVLDQEYVNHFGFVPWLWQVHVIKFLAVANLRGRLSALSLGPGYVGRHALMTSKGIP